MRRAVAVTIVAVLAVTGCRTATVSSVPAQKSSAVPVVKVPMRLILDIPFVQVEVCGQGPYWFVVDTGCAFPLAVSKQLAAEAKLPEAAGKVTVIGAIGTRTPGQRLVTVASARLGKAEMKGVALELDLSDAGEAFGAKVDGIVGYPLFSGKLMTLDFPQREFIVETGELPAADGEEVVDLKAEREGAVIDVALGTTTMEFLVDSGAQASLTVTEAAAGVLPFAAEPVDGPLTGGVGGFRRVRVGRLSAEGRIGRHVIENPLVSLMPPPVKVNRIGVDVLKHFSITFDQANGRMRFHREDVSPIAIPAYRTTGLGLRKRTDKWLVEDIIPNTPAEGLDIKPKDEIVAVNGRPVREIEIEAWEDLVQKADTVTLDMARGGRNWQVTVPVVTRVQ